MEDKKVDPKKKPESEWTIKPKHVFRGFSAIVGVSLVVCALVDGRTDWLPHLEAKWLLAAGAVLIGLAARKSVVPADTNISKKLK